MARYMRHLDPATRALPWLFLLYAAASFVHFAHNAEYLARYPNLPSWLTPSQIYLVWVCITAVGALGYALHGNGRTITGLAALALYAGAGFDGLLHYTRAPMASHTLGANLSIWFEVVAAALLAGVIALLAAKATRAARRKSRA